MKTLLELQHVSYAYHSPEGETQALVDLSFQIEQGDFVAVIGPSGCGKSTLLSIIAGLLKPEHGSVCVDGKSLEINSINIGYMLQRDYLLEWRSIYKNILLGLEIQHALTKETKRYANELLRLYGLDQFKNSKPSELSGGMRQRAALIRTLVLHPDLLLLDEPFSALDYQTRLNVGDDIGQIIKREKKTALLVTHDLSEAISLADKIIILTKRPASIDQILPLSFDQENDTPLRRRNTPEFKNYFNKIWEALNKNDQSISCTTNLSQ